MKRLILILLSLCTIVCSAQNYNCFEKDARHYFTNDIHYLRGIAIDSIQVSGADTIYYPFKTERLCSSCDDGSWLGGRVIKQSDGTFLFNTRWNDTVVIKTQGLPGDSWRFFDDTSARSYDAEVVSTDTMTFAGITDSVKRIRLKAYRLGILNPSDTLHNREFYISCNHGFVKIFDLYTFPYPSYSTDLYLYHVGSGTFMISDYLPPTSHMIFDFNPGDVFVTQGYSHSYMFMPSSSSSLIYDSVMTKTVIDTLHTQYGIRQWRRYSATYSSSVTHVSYNDFEYTLDADTTHLMTTNMPEAKSDFLMDYFYYPYDNTYCASGTRYTARLYIPFEGCEQEESYKVGFERCIYINNTPVDPWPGCDSYARRLEYSIKSGVPCGVATIKPNSIAQVENPTMVELSPNPTSGKLSISAAVNITSLTINDITGRCVFTGRYEAKQVAIDISSQPRGLYFVRINDSETRKVTKW